MLEGKKSPAANIQRSTQALGSGWLFVQFGNSQLAMKAAQKIASKRRKVIPSKEGFVLFICVPVYIGLSTFSFWPLCG
jgi:hypothetical protein